jgi:hypothetical protein
MGQSFLQGMGHCPLDPEGQQHEDLALDIMERQRASTKEEPVPKAATPKSSIKSNVFFMT